MTRSRSYNHRKNLLRGGFTLVETLLALALSSTLLLVVFSLIDSTVTYHVTGSDQVLVSQRLIGLLQNLRSDVRAVSIDPHWQAVPEAQLPIDERLETTDTRLNSQLKVPDLEKFAEPIRLVGQSDWLLLTLAHANPRWPDDAEHFQQVVWSLGGRGSLTVTTRDDNGRFTYQVLPGSSEAALLRTRIVSAPATQPVAQSERVIAAEDLKFRFLKSGRWLAQWNSAIEKGLPDAIEISIQLNGDAVRRSWVIQTAALHQTKRAMR